LFIYTLKKYKSSSRRYGLWFKLLVTFSLYSFINSGQRLFIQRVFSSSFGYRAPNFRSLGAASTPAKWSFFLTCYRINAVNIGVASSVSFLVDQELPSNTTSVRIRVPDAEYKIKQTFSVIPPALFDSNRAL